MESVKWLLFILLWLLIIEHNNFNRLIYWSYQLCHSTTVSSMISLSKPMLNVIMEGALGSVVLSEVNNAIVKRRLPFLPSKPFTMCLVLMSKIFPACYQSSAFLCVIRGHRWSTETWSGTASVGWFLSHLITPLSFSRNLSFMIGCQMLGILLGQKFYVLIYL